MVWTPWKETCFSLLAKLEPAWAIQRHRVAADPGWTKRKTSLHSTNVWNCLPQGVVVATSLCGLQREFRKDQRLCRATSCDGGQAGVGRGELLLLPPVLKAPGRQRSPMAHLQRPPPHAPASPLLFLYPQLSPREDPCPWLASILADPREGRPPTGGSEGILSGAGPSPPSPCQKRYSDRLGWGSPGRGAPRVKGGAPHEHRNAKTAGPPSHWEEPQMGGAAPSLPLLKARCGGCCSASAQACRKRSPSGWAQLEKC